MRTADEVEGSSLKFLEPRQSPLAIGKDLLVARENPASINNDSGGPVGEPLKLGSRVRLKVDDIAATLELSSGTVKRYLSDGLAKMAVSLRDEASAQATDSNRGAPRAN